MELPFEDEEYNLCSAPIRLSGNDDFRMYAADELTVTAKTAFNEAEG